MPLVPVVEVCCYLEGDRDEEKYLVLCLLVVFIFPSPRSPWSWEVWQILWHVVIGCHHIYSVSIWEGTWWTEREHNLLNLHSQVIVRWDRAACSGIQAWIKVPKRWKDFPSYKILLSTVTACVDSLHSTQTLVKPFLQGWREGFGWGNMDFPIQSGLKYQRKVKILPGLAECEHGGVQCCSAYRATVSKNLSELVFSLSSTN